MQSRALETCDEVLVSRSLSLEPVCAPLLLSSQKDELSVIAFVLGEVRQVDAFKLFSGPRKHLSLP